MQFLIVGETLQDFRELALRLIAQRVSPQHVRLYPQREAQPSLLETPLPLGPLAAPLKVSRTFLDQAAHAAAHRSPDRWDLLYRLLWRVANGEPGVFSKKLDDDVRLFETRVREVRDDLHKGEAFVRFRKVETEGEEHFIAWHRPLHRVLPFLAAFFQRRLPGMSWSLLTPDGSAHWNQRVLTFGPGVARHEAPTGEDGLEALWRRYYATTFNPARVNVSAMLKELPTKYWATLPETSLIPALLLGAGARTSTMTHAEPEHSASTDWLPATRELPDLAEAARRCEACPLHLRATQTVFGEGPSTARLMLVGEQPGDQEDLVGQAFVGPAGKMLDGALLEAGIERASVYLTNAVKHFKWEEGAGKRRIHARPNRLEALACKGWLTAEVEAVRPALIVCLGATAAQAFLGPTFKLRVNRGQIFQLPGLGQVLVTHHPAAVLRADPSHATRMNQELIEDLRKAAALTVAGL